MGESIEEARARFSPRLAGKTLPFYGTPKRHQPNLALDSTHIVPSISTQSSSNTTSITTILETSGDQSSNAQDDHNIVVPTGFLSRTIATPLRMSPRLLGKRKLVSPTTSATDLVLKRITPNVITPCTSTPGTTASDKVPFTRKMRVSPRFIAKPRPFFGPPSRNFLIDCPDENVLRGKVCDDISGGQERIPVPAFNLVDIPPLPPMGYTYSSRVRLSQSVTPPRPDTGCSCKGACTDPRKCACAKLNGRGGFPYVDDDDGGRLIQAKDVVFECGPNCACGPSCVNKTSQQGLRFRLELFRTPDKGWAVRSRDFIPSGAPVCEYTGILSRTNELDNVSGNDFIFHIDCLETVEGLDGRERRLGVVSTLASTHMDKSNDSGTQDEPEYAIDGCAVGGVARFINHSCDPNLFVQCVLDSHRDIKLARVMLFAAEDIPPMQELAYDYGYALDSVIGSDGKIKVMPCYCGAKDCRKRLY